MLLAKDRHWLWLLSRLGYFEGVWSTFIVGELVRIRVEHSIAHGVQRSVYRGRINTLIHLLSEVLQVANYRAATAAGMLDDPDDEPILAAALATDARFIVSLNTRDFPSSGSVAGVRFVTPTAFLAELESQHPGADVGEQARGAGRQLPQQSSPVPPVAHSPHIRIW